ncbi:L,D-transpeptidase family protein [Desulfoglaeba alkanexedens]|jgi:murein L,D-transpeptidase YcbB/YkuD|uniref:Peptidoglycan-binding protein n=1 Tax=Desulfoglaeba alkanexedens ALDC TaxID=980445 RepID=A0A4P8L4S2_9BACT|nr:L,D-transpeptidase family protein [Desulfoglaeba alkanexedens]QCQ23006.1 peptidoglycan-binding protein [Desulfoglaeba alkanexedens ALDC]
MPQGPVAVRLIRLYTRLAVFLSILSLPCWMDLVTAVADAATARAVQEILGQSAEPRPLYIACQKIHVGEDLIRFYADRSFAPAWTDANGLNDLGDELPVHLSGARDHGLDPEDYHLGCIEALADDIRRRSQKGGPPDVVRLASIDILMSDAFLIFASHLACGKVDPEKFHPLWLSPKHKTDILAELKRLLEHRDLRHALGRFAPPHPEYRRLVQAGRELRAVVVGSSWPEVPPGPTLHPGDTSRRVVVLRERLARSGDLPAGEAPVAAAEFFDPFLEEAVRRFQKRHGLAVDGVVGPRTLASLNVPPETRLRQILVNLERWRWLPRHLGDRYILVNVAGFSLEAYRSGEKVLTMRVIVGKSYQRTPVFSEKMRYIEVNPYWNVPSSIAVKEYLPKIRKDPGFLKANHMELLSGWGPSSRVLDPRAIDWSRVTQDNFPGRIRQLPGPWNALGRIKFMFPNAFNVYLHDTPERHLFVRPRRALSHGCIRVENPVDLALFVLQNDTSWTREQVKSLIDSGERHVIPLPHPVMVHLLYWTAWVDEAGVIHFREDIYGRDEILSDALGLS